MIELLLCEDLTRIIFYRGKSSFIIKVYNLMPFWAEGHKQNIENSIEAPMEATSCKVKRESRKTKVDVQTDIRPALSQWEFANAIEIYYHFCACLRISSSRCRYTMWKSLSS